LAPDAYIAALSLLARRELSAAQLRQRLKARRFPDSEIDASLNRLRESRALDDARVARAYARTAAGVKGRGRARVLREIEAMGIDRATAREAVAETFDALDLRGTGGSGSGEDALINRALDRKLRGRRIKDAAEFRRLYAFLMRQGFEAGKIGKALKERGGKGYNHEQ
jgi:regulatory protein